MLLHGWRHCIKTAVEPAAAAALVTAASLRLPWPLDRAASAAPLGEALRVAQFLRSAAAACPVERRLPPREHPRAAGKERRWGGSWSVPWRRRRRRNAVAEGKLQCSIGQYLNPCTVFGLCFAWDNKSAKFPPQRCQHRTAAWAYQRSHSPRRFGSGRGVRWQRPECQLSFACYLWHGEPAFVGWRGKSRGNAPS